MKLNEFKKTSADESAKKVDSKLNPETSIDINIISNKKSLKTKHIDFEQTPDSPKSFGSDSKGDKAKKVLKWLSIHKVFSCALIIFILFASFYTYKIYKIRQSNLDFSLLDPFRTVINAVTGPDENAISKLKKDNNRTNLLVVGVDARGKNGSLLTDSMMMMSYDHDKNEMAQISFPRDLENQFQIGNNYYNAAKLNAVFPTTYAATKSYDKAFENLGTEIEQVTGLKLHYGVMINFTGFKDIVDKLGGIEVNVENSFTDAEYPDENYGYLPPISFNQGTEKMNGTRALQYARSRKGNNGEGTDYARARRQQIVVNAIKKKFFESNILDKADALNGIVDILGDNLKFYNLGGDQINILIDSREKLKLTKTYAMVIDPNFGSYMDQLLRENRDPNNFLLISSSKQYDYKEVQKLVQTYLQNSYLLTEDAKITIICANQKKYTSCNNTRQTLLNARMKFDYVDNFLSAAQNQNTSDSVKIYKLNNEKSESAKFYNQLLNQNKVNTEDAKREDLHKDLEKFTKEKDILIVIQ